MGRKHSWRLAFDFGGSAVRECIHCGCLKRELGPGTYYYFADRPDYHLRHTPACAQTVKASQGKQEV